MIEYTWTISQLDCLPQTDEGTDYVVTAYWQLSGTDGTYAGSVYGSCTFPVVQGEDFIPFADLTLDTVLGWCYANGVDKDAMEDAVAQQIETQINPPIVSPPLPWASTEE